MSYDVILAGAGPCAVAALAAIPLGTKVLVSTGHVSRPLARGVPVHAKILSVAGESNEAPGLSDNIPFKESGNHHLFNSASVGGLANYWGQQFVRYRAGDPIPKGTFDSYLSYEQSCDEVERLFSLSPNDPTETGMRRWQEGYVSKTPRLLKGDAEDGESGLFAMRNTFHLLASQKQAVITGAPVKKWIISDGRVVVEFADGSSAVGKRLILAAGVVGTLSIVLASSPDCTYASFRDHAPHWFYTTGLPKRVDFRRSDGIRHFNALSIEREVEERVRLFSSVYRLSHAPMNLLLAMFRLPLVANGFSIPALADIMTPVQVWTEGMEMTYGIDRDMRMAEVLKSHDASKDTELGRFKSWLQGKARVWKELPPKPGGGFHYCDLRFHTNGETEVPIERLLRNTTNGLVTAVDGSALEELGCLPSGLTMMANAWAISKSIME